MEEEINDWHLDDLDEIAMDFGEGPDDTACDATLCKFLAELPEGKKFLLVRNGEKLSITDLEEENYEE